MLKLQEQRSYLKILVNNSNKHPLSIELSMFNQKKKEKNENHSAFKTELQKATNTIDMKYINEYWKGRKLWSLRKREKIPILSLSHTLYGERGGERTEKHRYR